MCRTGQGRIRKISCVLVFQVTSLAQGVAQERTGAILSLRNASVAERSREGLPVCGPLFFLTPSLLYFLFIVNLGNVLILNLIQKDINSQFGVTSLNLRKMGCDRWDFLFFRILTSKIFLSCFKLEVDINGMPSKDLYRQALLKICFFYF